MRKAIGKKIKSLLDEQKEKLTNGMIKNDIPKKTAEAIWELFPPFARYGFNKSHAAAYAMIGYRTAYLKAHYTEEFMASLLNAELSDIDRIAFLVNEAKQAEIEVLPPDINESSINFVPTGPKIRFGLLAIKNVGAEITKNIIEERSLRGPFRDINDLLVRVQHKDLNKKSLESLVKCGALDSLGAERNQLLTNLEEMLKFNVQLKKAAVPNNHASLFGAEATQPVLTLKPAPPASSQEKLVWEKELLGLYLSDHPLNNHSDNIKRYQAKPIAEARNTKSEASTLRICGSISRVQKITTKTGQAMLFATVEDLSPEPMEVVVFNSVLAKTQPVWEENNVVVVEGHISRRNGEVKFIAEKAKKLESAA